MRQGSRSDTWSVHDIQWLHCFAGPVACHVTITNGGIGTHLFNMLAIRRLGRQAHSLKHMLVSDRQNRVLHITQQLSAMLGSTPKGLMASGAKSTLEALLAQPFSQLHASLGCSVPPHQPPAYSCRSGLSVLMAGVGPQGPMSLPVSLSIRKKQHGMESEEYHITSIKPRTVGQALGERCVGLVLDSLGYVIDVAPDASDAVFGFPPKELMGRHVSTFVDILSPQQARKAAAPAATPNASLGGIQALLQGRRAQDHALDPGEAAVCKEDEEQVAQLLLELAGRWEAGQSYRIVATGSVCSCISLLLTCCTSSPSHCTRH
ncbi:hypothetical protein V8C86DRAFT_1720063 [Haematococcus lacustris]